MISDDKLLPPHSHSTGRWESSEEQTKADAPIPCGESSEITGERSEMSLPLLIMAYAKLIRGCISSLVSAEKAKCKP